MALPCSGPIGRFFWLPPSGSLAFISLGSSHSVADSAPAHFMGDFIAIGSEFVSAQLLGYAWQRRSGTCAVLMTSVAFIMLALGTMP